MNDGLGVWGGFTLLFAKVFWNGFWWSLGLVAMIWDFDICLI